MWLSSKGSWNSLWHHMGQVLYRSSNKVERYETDMSCTRTKSLTLKFVSCLAYLKQIIKKTTFVQRVKVYSWLLTKWPQNQLGSSTLYGYHWTNFGNSQAKASKDIERAPLVNIYPRRIWIYVCAQYLQKCSM